METTTTGESGSAQRKVVVAEIRREREARGLTREQLAIKADCSVTMLAQIERGLVPRRGYVVHRVIRVLEEAA